MSETASERVARLLRDVAAPAVPGERVVHAIARAARRLGWDRGRTKRLWYREARRVDADEMLAIDRYLKREATDEFARLNARIARVEASLRVSDPDMYGPDIDALHALGRRPDSPMGG